MPTPKVLIIDDSPEVGELLSFALSTAGIETFSALTGEEGIRLARGTPMDLAMIDLTLPDMDGLDICKVFRSEAALSQVPLVMITGRTNTEDKVRAFEMGASDYINKPFNIQEVLARIQSVLRRKKSLDVLVAASQRERQRTLEELRSISKAIDSAGDAIIILNVRAGALYANPSFLQLSEASLEDLRVEGAICGLFESLGSWEVLWHSCLGQKPWNGELLVKARTGRAVPCLCRANAVVDEEGQVTEVVVTLTDITQRKQLENDLLYIANHDPLTGLDNRRFFSERLSEFLRGSGGKGQASYLLYLDIDNFKVINSVAGYDAGDRLLKEIGEILRTQVRGLDRVARIGGDDFTLLLLNVTEEQAAAAARRLVETFDNHRFSDGGRIFSSTASVGVVRLTEGMTAEDAVAHAGSACYLTKAHGRNGWEMFKPDNEEIQQLTTESLWSIRLKDALRAGRVELWLQPILPVRESLERVYFEVLVRMRGPEGELVMPSQFMRAAERFGNTLQLDDYVVRRSFALLKANPQLHLSINLSGKTLNDPGLPGLVEGLITESGIESSRASFEVTETDMIRSLSYARQLILRIRRMGCKFALDDFGSGASSMTYLRDLPVDYLKIDGSFIKELDHDPVSRSLVRAMNEVAHILGKQTVAEYVTNPAVFAQVQEIGLDFAQGWHVCEPAPPEKFLKESGGATPRLPQG